MLLYPVNLIEDDGAFCVTFPDVPEAITEGATREEALKEAVDALLTAFMIYEDERRAFPLPSKTQGDTVRLSVTASLKIFLHNAMIEKGWRKVDLARKMGWSNSQVERALDPRYATRIDSIESALASLGKAVKGDVVALS